MTVLDQLVETDEALTDALDEAEQLRRRRDKLIAAALEDHTQAQIARRLEITAARMSQLARRARESSAEPRSMVIPQ